METRRKCKLAAKVATQQQDHCDTSDTESVATQLAFEDGSESDYSFQQEKVGHHMTSSRKRLHSHTQTVSKNGATVVRQPTRRPDPNVSNRNALMARENRKRKKEQMEQLEHENGNLQRDLRKLQKVVDRQEVMIRGLRNERNYLKSVLENQSDIVTLLKRLQPEEQRTETAAKQGEKQQTQYQTSSSPTSIYSDSGMSFSGDNSPFYEKNKSDDAHFDSSEFDNGTINANCDLFDVDALLNIDFPLISTDLMFSSVDPFTISSDIMADDVDLFEELAESEQEENNNNIIKEEDKNGNLRCETIRSEHNYVYSDTVVPYSPLGGDFNNNYHKDGDDEEDDILECKSSPSKRRRLQQQQRGPGICLHIGGGKVSIEFCAQCHESATRDWHVKRL